MSQLFKKKKSYRKSHKDKLSDSSSSLNRSSESDKEAHSPHLEASLSDSGDFSGSIVEEIEEVEGLVFTEEREHGRPVIKGGNIEKLVERLTFHKYNDVKYVQAFMLTFRSFTTPRELLQLLINRYNITPDTNGSSEETTSFESIQKVVRLRVFNILKNWLAHAYYDFSADSTLKQNLVDFIESSVKPSLPNPANTLLNSIEKQETAAKKEVTLLFTMPPPKPLLLPQNKTGAQEILDYHPTELARQLTLIEYRLYSSIKPSECVGQNWMSSRKEELAPNILAMIHRFNHVSTWLSSEIVRCHELSKRIQVLRHVLDIAEACRELNNFNALMEIISGLNSSSIFRLKQTWAGLPRKYVSMFEEMRSLMSRDLSYKNFRAYLHNVNPPCIPYLGMYLTDLTFVEEGNKDNLPNGFINITKRRQLARIISEIQTYQNTPYCLQDVEYVQDYLQNGEALPEQQCYTLSLKREGRDGTVDDQTPDLPYGELEKRSSYLFDTPDSEENIIFAPEKEGSTNTPIVAATEIKLMERLTLCDFSDAKLTATFLMAYQEFTTPERVIELLQNRFDMPRPANPSKQQMAKFQSLCMVPTHLRMMGLLHNWAKVYAMDFMTNKELEQQTMTMVQAWAEENPLLKNAVDTLRKILNKNAMRTLPTPECRYVGFLHQEEPPEDSPAEGKTLLDFDDDLLVKQLTLIEQHFFTSIQSRECLAPSWEEDVIESKAPNFFAILTNADIVRRWTITEVLRQKDNDNRYRCLSILIYIAQKLLEANNYSSGVSVLRGLQYLHEHIPTVWEWVPSSIVELYEDLTPYVEDPTRTEELASESRERSLIPCIDPFIQELSEVAASPSRTGELIRFEKYTKYFDIYSRLEAYRYTPFPYEYSDSCGGYLYHCEVWDMPRIEQAVADLPPVDPPDLRPDFDDIHYPDHGLTEMNEDNDESVTSKKEEAALENLREHFLTVIRGEDELFQELMGEARTNVTNDLLLELRSFASCIQDELAIIQTQFGAGQVDKKEQEQQQEFSLSSLRVVQRIFPGFTISHCSEMDSEGAVYGWEDQVTLLKVTRSEEQVLVCVTPQLKKSDASNVLRLFKFFNETSDAQWKNALVVSSSCSLEATSVMAQNGIALYNFYGESI